MGEGPSTLVRGDLLALFNGAKLLHGGSGGAGLTGASLFATPRYVLLVPHTSLELMVGVIAWFQQAGPDARSFEASWRETLAGEEITTEAVEAALVEALEPEQVLELARLARYKVTPDALSSGFYYKETGAWTWDGLELRFPEQARRLQEFLDRHRGEVERRAAELRVQPQSCTNLGRGRAWPLLAIGVALGIIGLLCGIFIAPGFAIGSTIVSLPLVSGGVWHLIFGKPVDDATRRPPGWWSSGFTLTLVVSAFVGTGLFFVFLATR
jgi:hypothetical protein